jgi:hypothetical protein
VMYAHFIYNKNVLEGKSNYPYINADVAVVDITWNINTKFALHSVGEHLYTKQDHGNWAAIQEELSIGQHFYIAVLDQWNYGNDIESHRVHYYKVQGGFSKGTNQIVFGYGKQREGILCVGGVCRQVPASNGFTLTLTSSF